MDGVSNTAAQPSISMPSTTPTESVGSDLPAPETKPTAYPGSHSHSLLPLAPRTCSIRVQDGRYIFETEQVCAHQPIVTSAIATAKLTASLKTPYHNRRPRMLPLNPQLHFLPAHISPCTLSVAFEIDSAPLSHPAPLADACHYNFSATPARSPSHYLQPHQPHHPPNQHPHHPPLHRPCPPLCLASHPPVHLLSTRPLPPRDRPNPMSVLHPLPSSRKYRPPN